MFYEILGLIFTTNFSLSNVYENNINYMAISTSWQWQPTIDFSIQPLSMFQCHRNNENITFIWHHMQLDYLSESTVRMLH